nr:MAG TPA: AAA ATPase [Caudoviricetes sp.]
MEDFVNKLSKVHFTNLKNLRDLTISFEPHNVTGIFGANGSGKSTIIHALSVIFQPIDQNPNDRRKFHDYKFGEFFKSTSIYDWKNSKFEITISDKTNENKFITKDKIYTKTQRWTPRYDKRPKRCAFFIGIRSCVPDVELEKTNTRITFSKDTSSTMKDEFCRTMSKIFERKYIEASAYATNRKKYKSIKNQKDGEYCSLSMGAGEQRAFTIVSTILNAPDESLIIIDEIDLTLHTKALNTLLDFIIQKSVEKKLQVIFTSHREEILKRQDINIRNIYQRSDNKTVCFDGVSNECLQRLTGRFEKPLQIYVEDAFSKEIVSRVALQSGVRKSCDIITFGAINNAYLIASTKVIDGGDLDKVLIVTDGDRDTTQEEKTNRIKKVFSGTENDHEEKVRKCVELITQYNSVNKAPPELFVFNILKNLGCENEIVSRAKEIGYQSDSHNYITQIISDIYETDDVSRYYNEIIDLITDTDEWMSYVKDIKNWLDEKKSHQL